MRSIRKNPVSLRKVETIHLCHNHSATLNTVLSDRTHSNHCIWIRRTCQTRRLDGVRCGRQSRLRPALVFSCTCEHAEVTAAPDTHILKTTPASFNFRPWPLELWNQCRLSRKPSFVEDATSELQPFFKHSGLTQFRYGVQGCSEKTVWTPQNGEK